MFCGSIFDIDRCVCDFCYCLHSLLCIYNCIVTYFPLVLVLVVAYILLVTSNDLLVMVKNY